MNVKRLVIVALSGMLRAAFDPSVQRARGARAPPARNIFVP